MVARHRLAISIPSLLVLLFAVVGSTGCTYHQLRKNTANQAFTVSELHQQQVLDNVAMFVNNKDALPFFALPKQGTSEVNDKGAITPLLTWSRLTTAPLAGSFLFNTAQTTMTAERATKQNWTLDPINDPRKLELMRCAYQRAIGSCCGGSDTESCPNCSERFNRFYTGSKGKAPDGSNVTADCLLNTCCWFRVGTKHDVPKDCCNFVGKYCDTYVWVPHSGRDTLSKLTLVILDFAMNDARKLPTKEVVYYLDADGRPTTFASSVAMVTANISVSDTNNTLLLAPYAEAIAQILRRNKVEISDLNELTAADIVLQVKDEGDYRSLVNLLHRSGFVTDKEKEKLLGEILFARRGLFEMKATDDATVKAAKAVEAFIEEYELDSIRIQLSPTASSSDIPSSQGLPPVLQLNQLLETVR